MPRGSIYPRSKIPSLSSNEPKRSYFRVWGTLGMLSLAGLSFWFFNSHNTAEDSVPVVVEAQAETVIPEQPKENVVTHQVTEGDIPAEVFGEYGRLDANAIEALLTSSESVYDFSKIRIGRELQFVFDEEERLKKLRYYFDTESMIVVDVKEGAFHASKESIPYQRQEEFLVVEVDEFLYKDGLDAGLTEASILEIADIFSFDIDFTTELRTGDELKVLYEKRTLDGKPAPDGTILAAKFTNAGQEYFAYYFEPESTGAHYDAEGNELVRQFLRAPLTYRSITSGYTGARLHPITKTVTAHYQIDYAAPMGTPVVATARGTVVSARFEGGWGNIVRLRHDNGYTTHYAHLSGYAKGATAGSSVSQGQIIGYVGSTGWSTGPHLDYGMRLNGNPVNPLSLSLPKGAPLSGEQKERFQEMRQRYDERLR